MVDFVVRPAVENDVASILEIHNAAIVESLAIWSEETVDIDERLTWFAERARGGNPILVAESGAEVIGYASYGPWRQKSGYRFTVENSVYVRSTHRGGGVGRALMGDLIARARAAGLHAMIADIESGNEASIRLHESFGFVREGLVREVGTKFGRWLDLAILRLPLHERES